MFRAARAWLQGLALAVAVLAAGVAKAGEEEMAVPEADRTTADPSSADLVEPAPASSEEAGEKPGGDKDLRSKLQNPVGSVISVPVETTIDFGAPDGSAVFINLQPVVPIKVGPVNLINRTILPLIYAPGPIEGKPGNPVPVQGDDTFGLGDISHSVFVSPVNVGKIIWGIGPIFSFPSATDDVLGSGKWSAGPTAVVLTQPKPWTLGVLVGNLWSFAGDSDRASVNQMFVQPFVQYNLDHGWYLSSSPMITANWKAPTRDRWIVPIGGGFGKLFQFGSLPVNTRVEAFYHVERPSTAPDWSMRFTVQLVFPK
jgi:hypothetical protein